MHPSADSQRSVAWQFPLFVAIVLHAIIFAGSVYAPQLFKSTPRRAVVQTVSLISLPEPPKAVKKAVVQKKVVKKSKKKVPKKKKTPPPPPKPPQVSTPAPPAEPVAPPRVISLNPKKKKVKKRVPKKPTPDPAVEKARRKKAAAEKRRQEEARKKVEELARSIQEQQRIEEQKELAEERARLAREQLDDERRLLEEMNTRVAERTEEISAGNERRGSSNTSDSNLSRVYNGQVAAHLGANWKPPVNLSNPSIEATVAVTIDKSGKIIDMQFEKRSGDLVYDQFVIRALEASDPFPPIPPALNADALNYGFVFTPQGIE